MYLQASDLRQVMQSLRFALQPAVDTISVDWTVPEGVTVDMLSPPINTLFQGQRALIYAQIKGQVKASNGFCRPAPFVCLHTCSTSKSDVFHLLAAAL